jgi:hypothetical protein
VSERSSQPSPEGSGQGREAGPKLD